MSLAERIADEVLAELESYACQGVLDVSTLLNAGIRAALLRRVQAQLPRPFDVSEYIKADELVGGTLRAEDGTERRIEAIRDAAWPEEFTRRKVEAMRPALERALAEHVASIPQEAIDGFRAGLGLDHGTGPGRSTVTIAVPGHDPITVEGTRVVETGPTIQVVHEAHLYRWTLCARGPSGRPIAMLDRQDELSWSFVAAAYADEVLDVERTLETLDEQERGR